MVLGRTNQNKTRRITNSDWFWYDTRIFLVFIEAILSYSFIMFLSVQLIKLLKSSIIWTVHQIGINNGIYGFWIISPYLMIKRLHSRLRSVALVTWNTSCWRVSGEGGEGSVFLWQAHNGGSGLKLHQNLSSWILFPFVKNYCEKGSRIKDLCDYYISDNR